MTQTNCNVYKHDLLPMKNSENKIKELLKEYNEKILDIKKLTDEIYTSTEWKDVELKETFNNTCNGYINIEKENLNNIIKVMEQLGIKINSIEEFENLYN